jgi:hypothetical protein
LGLDDGQAALAWLAAPGREEAGMLWHLAEWAGAVLAAGVVAGLAVAAAGAVGAWLVYRWARRRVEAFAGTAARYALQAVPVMAAVRRRRLPPQVVYHLRRRLGGAPGLE